MVVWYIKAVQDFQYQQGLRDWGLDGFGGFPIQGLGYGFRDFLQVFVLLLLCGKGLKRTLLGVVAEQQQQQQQQ